MNVLGIIQTRMSSTRFPGKAMRKILGNPMFLMCYDRARQATLIDKLIIATSIDKTDDIIRDVCLQNKIPCFRGSLEDVLDRYFMASQMFWPEHIVRITADCPLIDSEIIDRTITTHLKGKHDYTRNYGYFDGLDTEVMTFPALQKAWREAVHPYEREHVTPYFYNHPEMFNLGRLENYQDSSAVKISVDTEEDLVKIGKLLEVLVCLNSTFRIQSVS